MKRNELIENLIRHGKGEFHTAEKQEELRKIYQRQDAQHKWEILLEKARSYFDTSLKDAIDLLDEVKNDWSNPPVITQVRFVINVENCAPFQLAFIVEDDIFIKAIFRSPNIVEDENEGKLVWNYGAGMFYEHKDFPDTKVSIGGDYGVQIFQTSRLDLALADASQKFIVMENLQENLLAIKQEKNLQYENLDGSEPLPDLVLVEGMRRLIREEISKLHG